MVMHSWMTLIRSALRRKGSTSSVRKTLARRRQGLRTASGQVADIEILESRQLLAATVITVDVATDVHSDGHTTLREAIAQANLAASQNGQVDTILFKSTLQGQTITLTQGEIAINQSMNIIGEQASPVTISGGNSSRIFNISATGYNSSLNKVLIDGLTLTSGNAGAGNGGAILNAGILTINNDAISSSSAANGGAIYNTGTLTVKNSTFVGDSATNDGGAIYSTGSLRLISDTISGNTAAGVGGGVYVASGTILINSTIVSGNTASASADLNTGSGSGNQIGGTTSSILKTASGSPVLASNGGPAKTVALVGASTNPALGTGVVPVASSLSGAVTATAIQIGVSDTSSLNVGDLIKIDSEIVLITASSSSSGSGTLTVIRGQLGTTAAAHAVAAPIQYLDGRGLPRHSAPDAGAFEDQLRDVTTTNSYSGNEGATISGPLTLMTFTTLNSNAVAADFSAFVNWGGVLNGAAPGTTFIKDLAYVGPGSRWSVQVASVSFQVPGNYTVGVNVNDSYANAASTSKVTFNISQLALTNPTFTNSVPTNIYENDPVGSINAIASFVDPGYQDPLNEYSAVINWGDSTTSAGTVVVGTASITGYGSTFNVNAPSHTYAEEGPYNITVTIVHGSSSVQASGSITILDKPLANAVFTGVLPSGVNEGQATGAINRLATFVDTGDIDPTSEYVAVINWGDSTTSAGTVTVGTGGDAGKLVVNTTGHTYALYGSYTISVTIDHNGSIVSASSPSPIVIVDPPLTNLATNTMPTGLYETQSTGALNVATFSDPGSADPLSSYVATINWGDSTTSAGTVVSLGSGNFKVTSSGHTYNSPGTFAVNVTLTHNALSPQTTPSKNIVITDAPIVDTTQSAQYSKVKNTNFTAVIATWNDYNPNAAVGDFQKTITWGTANVVVTFANITKTGSGTDINGKPYVTFSLSVLVKFTASGQFTPTVVITDPETPISASNTFTSTKVKFTIT